MTDLKNKIIKERYNEQHILKNKNNGIKQKVGKADIVDIEYCKERGNGCFAKGLRKICIEHRVTNELLNRTNGDTTVKKDILLKLTSEFIDNISLIDQNLANNHFGNLPALMCRYVEKQIWKPELLNADPEKTKIYGKGVFK